ncbi:MAG TPA: hypothetical protein VLN44_02860 [Pyrinomonadaceae bacterium]|nr:hypothetical protein [Pyrinomonadaceae bacterium]
MTDFNDQLDQEKRIEKLRAELLERGGEISHESDLPADLEEEFLKHILEFETSEQLTLMQWLANAGLEVTAPEELSDERLSAKLREIINRMASLGAYLHNTDHLSDRDLYQYLYHDALREPTVLFPDNPGYVYGIDLLGSGSDEDMQLYMRYFADEEYRQRWSRDFPDFEMPPRETPPFDRDKDLPKSPFG